MAGVEVSLDECRAGYDIGALFLLTYPLVIGALCDTDDPRAVALARAVLPRSSATVSARVLLRLLDGA